MDDIIKNNYKGVYSYYKTLRPHSNNRRILYALIYIIEQRKNGNFKYKTTLEDIEKIISLKFGGKNLRLGPNIVELVDHNIIEIRHRQSNKPGLPYELWYSLVI